MGRGIKLVAAVAVLAGLMLYLSSRVGEQPMAKQEQAVNLDELAK